MKTIRYQRKQLKKLIYASVGNHSDHWLSRLSIQHKKTNRGKNQSQLMQENGVEWFKIESYSEKTQNNKKCDMQLFINVLIGQRNKEEIQKMESSEKQKKFKSRTFKAKKPSVN